MTRGRRENRVPRDSWPASPRSALQLVEIVDIGAKDLHPTLVRLEELPGARRRKVGADEKAGEIDSQPFQLSAVIVGKSLPTAAK